ncbi:MAG: hypothetical protein CMI93_00580 [Pelagibacteraceae bacterium]|jgi:hypothetical protein|nr:hypothetical protein [Pelagibacteraceae bacterium]|tara:strand:- start:3535 stop:4116 length:582 start_codon:yes stop_codon:yes gene_type:complete
MKLIKLFALFFFFVFQISNLQAFEDKATKGFMGVYEVKQGILAHDRGWFGKNREGIGPDYNFELMFNSPNILKKVWSPKPIIGLTQNSSGGSSLYYGGITWDANISKNWFVTGTTGIAYTNGLKKLPQGQVATGDKKIQFGSQWLHRGAIELGWNFYGNDTISLMFSHVSHASMLSDKNHGMDEFGIRYGYRF